MHKVLELRGHPKGASVSRYFYPSLQKMMVKIHPGEVYVTSDDELIGTGLGSCISACIWDPEIGIGGMNHFMLPLGTSEDIAEWTPTQWRSRAARYGNYAMELLINTLIQQGAEKHRLQVKLFGGGVVMGQCTAVGEKNIAFAIDYVTSEGLVLVSNDLGDDFPRKLIFEPKTGKAWVKKMRSYKGDVQRFDKKYQRTLQSPKVDSGDSELF
ncbi:chemotaxis protein CheD [Veronia nyctiphanis]|uniref:Probable chemoreceptor glutamine deamidase CheD n=1 Tax=Veronia nyctiphanis TaxID=1278244 RepID=A0A4Q0YNB6_9GAMM|nr:chemotaxis protein CheD [Veronia nyctiphanis]RXJ72437.1 chemotaxis protein CheD [Veronia nyctiphanis]